MKPQKKPKTWRAIALLTLVGLLVLSVAYPIANQASDKAKTVTLIVWGSLLAISYLGYGAYRVFLFHLDRKAKRNKK